MIFRVVHTPKPLIRCTACQTETRLWDDRQAAQWKRAHQANCPRYAPKETSR